MINLRGYTITRKIYSGNKISYYYGQKQNDSTPVLVKAGLSEPGAPNNIPGLQREYELLENLECQGVPKTIGLEKFTNGLAIISEHVNGVPLTSYLNENKINIQKFLSIAVSVTKVLGDLHKNQVIHKDLRPENIFVNKQTHDIWIVDLQFASLLPKDKPEIFNPAIIEGSLAYISPEQTGKVNQPVDYRTDFYSLGVMLYKILTDRLPFEDTNPLQFVHSLLAKQPTPPAVIDAGIPKVISDIVMKLLSKNAEDRYLSAQGLIYDLEQCRRQFEKEKKMDGFTLGEKDFPNNLQIPQRIYSREKENRVLLEMFEKTSLGNMGIVVISGPPGIGKTSLVLNTQIPVIQKNGLFIKGKFDPFHQNVPYSALIDAFHGLVKQMLTENEERLKKWKNKLLSVLGDYGQLIVNLIPEIELIIGKQPPIKAMDSNEYKNLINRIKNDFISVFTGPEHPLVIFLDDLQWVDTSTLRLIENTLIDSKVEYCLLIISYRDDEVNASHPLLLTLNKLEKAKFVFTRLSLKPLHLDDVKQLVADTLHSSRQSVAPLSELVSHKTNGNPFFIRQFLQTLYQEHLLYFKVDDGLWEWDLQAIAELDSTENVVKLLVRRLERMPHDTRYLMMMGACIGSRFDLDTLVKITQYTDLEILKHLSPALQQDLLITSLQSEEAKNATTRQIFIFSHDRVRQASYSLISNESKKSTHKQIGDLLLKNIESFERDEEVIDIIHHLNIGEKLVRKQQERDKLAELNFIAGVRSLGLAAFEPAFNYFTKGIRILGKKSWKRKYKLTLNLYSKCIEAARLCGNIREMENLFEVVEKNARTTLDLVSAYQSKIMSLISEDHRLEALDMTREILKEFGVLIPARPTQKDMDSMLKETISELSGRNIEELANLPEMKNPDTLAAMKFIIVAFGVAYQLHMELFVMLMCQGVKLSFRHGNVPGSAIVYGGVGLILCGYDKEIDLGYKFGQLASELIRRLDAKELKAKIYLPLHGSIHHWKFHLRESIEPLYSAYVSGRETGDFEYAGYTLFFSNFYAFLAGESLTELDKRMSHFMEIAVQLKQMQLFTYITVIHETILSLIGQKEAPFDLLEESGNKYSVILIPQETGDKIVALFYYFCRMMISYLFGLYEDAVRYADQANELMERAIGLAVSPACLVFDSLCRLAVYDASSPERKEQILVKVKTNQKMMKNWADHAPMNYMHKYFLVEAELSKIQSKNENAVRYYNHSIRKARENHYDNDEALANELMAQYWLDREHYELAEVFMKRAYARYRDWGATHKADHLVEQYPHLMMQTRERRNQWAYSTYYNKKQQVVHNQDLLDLATLMKSSQAIFSEIVLDNLLGTMMRIVIENAGADKGFFILNKDNELKIAAMGLVEVEKISAKPCDFLDIDADELSSKVVRFVARTRKPIVLHNASTDDRFKNDPYLRKHFLISVLCIPIIYKSELIGLIYLENRMTPDVFSSDRIEVLNLLASQIAISIDNSRLFERHKKAEKKYRGIFENALEGIFLISVEGRIASANPSMAHLLGYDSPEELIEKINDISSQVHASSINHQKFLREIRTNKKIENFETQFMRKDGSLIWVSVNARAIFDENGAFRFLEGFIIDITERKVATDALRQREENLRRENIRLKADIKDRYRFGNIIGKSAKMQNVYTLVLKAAATDATVIIYGESGTGKELVAKAIHDASDRKNHDFIPVNCSAIPENLLESEFFGYRKGAFTGAHADKEGYLDLAKDGTLFLDELGEINLSFQVKLLRVLEDGSYRPLGGRTVKKTNARVVAATSRDLQKAVKNGFMREDFFYRIHVIPIHLPSLRERREDIPFLIEHFLKIHNCSNEVPPVSAKIIENLCSHRWPGNVRELQNVIQRYCAIGSIDLLSNREMDIEPDIKIPDKEEPDEKNHNYHDKMADTEKKMIIEALEQNRWNRTKAAEQLNINLRSFYRKLKKYNIL